METLYTLTIVLCYLAIGAATLALIEVFHEEIHNEPFKSGLKDADSLLFGRSIIIALWPVFGFICFTGLIYHMITKILGNKII